MSFNRRRPDPTQKMIFDWMPLIFTFMLAGFRRSVTTGREQPLSFLQQSFIMRRNG